MPDDTIRRSQPSEPAWKRNFIYRTLRRGKQRVNSRLQAAKLQRRVEQGFRLVPERDFEACLRHALLRLQAEGRGEPLGDYLEFGVCHGSSMACMHRVTRELGLDGMRLIGFDSFEGLPPEAAAPGEGPWRPGQYRSDIRFTERFLTEAGVDWDRTVLVKGWFNETLTAETRARHGITKAGVIMVDCDIYTSARQALDFCAPLIGKRAVILFDDWNSGNLAEQGLGEKRAFDELLAANPTLATERLPGYSPNAEVFMVRRQAEPMASRLQGMALWGGFLLEPMAVCL